MCLRCNYESYTPLCSLILFYKNRNCVLGIDRFYRSYVCTTRTYLYCHIRVCANVRVREHLSVVIIARRRRVCACECACVVWRCRCNAFLTSFQPGSVFVYRCVYIYMYTIKQSSYPNKRSIMCAVLCEFKTFACASVCVR